MRRFAAMLFALVCLSAAAAPPAPAAERRLVFNRDIRPILSDNCFRCHGPDSGARKAGLRLDRREVAIAKGAIIPGKPDESELIARVCGDDPETRMPPPASNKTLKPEQKA